MAYGKPKIQCFSPIGCESYRNMVIKDVVTNDDTCVQRVGREPLVKPCSLTCRFILDSVAGGGPEQEVPMRLPADETTQLLWNNIDG